MSDAPTLGQNINKGRHYEFIKNTISDNFKDATVGRGRALAAAGLKIEPWYTTSPATHHDKLKAANLKAWRSQNTVDKLFEKLDLHSFAAPLLQAELKKRYGVEHDVKTTYVRLYLPKDLPWYVMDLWDGVTARTVSMLDAALHNFAKSEKVDTGSDFITEPDHRGHFDVLSIKRKMTISQFQALCRELDIGARYKAYLESYLLPGDPAAKAFLRHTVTESQKDALAVAAQLALMTEDIQYDAYKLILALAKGESLPLLNGKQMLCCDFSMMGTRMTGIVLLLPVMQDSGGIRRLIAYVPHDPDHPLKEYESTDAFMTELARQLRENKVGASSRQSYRQFFSQFVDQQQRGHFFANMDRGLTTIKWHEKGDRTDPRPAWREEPVPRLRLQFLSLPVPRDYWTYAYQQKLNKVLNDAREIAVSTADTDTKARWAWWDNFKKIVSDLFNVALLIATPFVPGLGELMMAYTAYQLTNDVIEGIVDLAEGLAVEATEHVISVVTDVIQLVAFGAGAAIGSTLRFKLSALVEGMNPVTLPNGKQSLWHSDLKPYEQASLNLPTDSKPDALGLHRHLNQNILPLEGKLYALETTSRDPSATHRLKHPTRPNAYSPKLKHNGSGAWVFEGENPLDWKGEILMRRLGQSVERFTPAERERIRISSATDEGELRRMHAEHAPPPPLLVDAIKRFGAFDDVQIASANIRTGRPLDPSSVWFEPLLTRLQGWPAERALKVYERSDLSGQSRTYGNAHANDANTLSIGLPELLSGRLPERVSVFLNDTEINTLLGRDVPRAERTQAVRDRLADAVDQQQGEMSKRVYQAGERSNRAQTRVLKQTFPDMPLTLTEKVLTEAKPAELQRIADESRLPLRIKTLAREVNFEASNARAYDGFYRDEMMVPNTEMLALRTLTLHNESLSDLRIEVRDGAFDGPLRCSVGPDDASTVRLLIRDGLGRYEVLDGDNRQLHKAGDFYEAILNALPDDQRTALGYARGHGRLLKLWIMETSAPSGERRTLLAEPPIRAVATTETVNLVRGPFWFFGEKTPEQRIKELHPQLSDQQVTRFLEALRAKGDPDQAIDRIRDDLKQLRNTLQAWRENQPTQFDSVGDPIAGINRDFLQNGGRHIEERLLECFERKSETFGERNIHPDGGYTLDLSAEIMGPDLERWWKQVRKLADIGKFLDQITVLNLDKARFSVDSNGLLNDFPNLRQLSARNTGLTTVPSDIGKLGQLTTLDLADNRISLSSNSLEQLSNLTHLETLRLDGNPLRQPPNVGGMRDLKVLGLANTGIEDWPQGLFSDAAGERNRPRGFALDMRQCPIKTVPEVAPGSDQAFILARARFGTLRLSDADRIRFGDYRESMGFARQQVYSGAVEDELSHWKPSSNAPSVFDLSEGYKVHREESWHDVMAEPGSTDFFRVISKQRESRDYRDVGARQQLTKRVWQMIDAMALDSDLREELFKQASQPESCADAGSQLFNNMGLKVLVSQAYTESASTTVLDDKLVRLARSAARLEKVGDVARAEISSQQQKFLINPANNTAPDDVEVHLAFETGLAKRLELPWQSEGMLFEPRSGVDRAKIDTAYDTIIEREKGDGLVNGMVDAFENPFWEQHLRKTYPEQFESNDQLFKEKQGQLEELREVQNQWANNQDKAQTTRLQKKLEALARVLNVPEKDVFSGEEMSTSFYNRLVRDMGYARNELARDLTRAAMARAGL
ncbi:hypothetical protein E3W21_01375 [Pseudomonas sp. F01002]|nr:hypothetical protein E3W21_01375 [Pseudomonas sp. F01002]